MRPDGLRPVEWARQVPLDFPLFEGEPSGETGSLLAQALAPLFEKAKKTYCTFQVALPDPLVKFEVFEMDKVPPRGKAMEEFLAWRFNQDLNKEETRPPLAFASQLLGEEDGKSLVLAMGVEKNWLLALQQAFEKAGAPVSVMDMALGHRFNFFYDAFREKGGSGALVSIEPEYWNLALWDGRTRLRFARSKWWKGETGGPSGIPPAETVLEIERTIRSYVYSGKDRSVEKIFVLAPPQGLGPVLEALAKRTGGNCEGLSPDGGRFLIPPGGLGQVAPSALAAAVPR